MFGLFDKKPRSEVGNAGGFGKVPALGDFIRTSSPSEECIAFEAWLTRALESAEAKLGPELKKRFVDAPAYAFIWSGVVEKKTRGLFAGVIVTSHDAVGRSFPIVVGAPLPPAALAGRPHVAPLVLQTFYADALDVATSAKAFKTASEFQSRVSAVARPAFASVDGELARYKAWAKSQSAPDRWTSLFGNDGSAALGLLIDAVLPYRGQDASPQTLGLRVPLGNDGANMAALWIDLVRNAAAWKTMIPSIFFPLSGPDRNLLIQLGAEAPPSVLADLYAPDPDSEAVCDLTLEPDRPSVRTDLANGQTLADVAAQLARL